MPLIHDHLLHRLAGTSQHAGEVVSGEGRVKWLGSNRPRVRRESARRHEGDGPQAADVAVVQDPAVPEGECDGRVAPFGRGEISGIDQERAGETWLDYEPIAG